MNRIAGQCLEPNPWFLITTIVTIDKAHAGCNMNTPIERLDQVRQRIESACLAANRRPDEIRLLAVSKRQPADKVSELNRLGVSSFGENQLQEALDKQRELANLDLEWHFIGAIQSNKTRLLAGNFQWLQGVDRERILKRLSAQRPTSLPPLNICLQVNIDFEPQKAGASPAEIMQLADIASRLERIALRGLMAIPKMTNVVAEQRDSFRRVRLLFESLKKAGYEVDTLSMGMSSDLEVAISEGSTMVRIGTDLLGKRVS
jgi:pyridoxal phosphate enzyme (YggS family)